MTGQLVLVADDSRAIRTFVRRALEDAGFSVVEAADGRQALTRVVEQPPDAILLDVDMPELNGFGTLEVLKAQPATARIPVLFLTAHSAADDAVTGLGLGAQDYIRKPCAPAELAARVRTAIALRGQVEELTLLSSTDALTGLPNRRTLDRALAAVAEAGATRHGPVAVAVVDIDHFKQVNDRQGHPAGDVVLRTVAQRLSSVVPAGGCLGRWGGEEFLCVLPGLDLGAAVRVGESLRRAVFAEPVRLGATELRLSVSVGVAAGIGADGPQLLHEADAAVYEAKRCGRNRVVPALAGTVTRLNRPWAEA
ncbi:MAG TPA: diguanylate cyclase [Kribbellaceae bacterium]|jgi:diguanylate cyclase (GGDEF)-like protein